MFFHANFLPVSTMSFFRYTISSSTCCFWSSRKHSIRIELSTQKLISLYLIIVSLIAFRRPSLYITFRRGIFNFFASYNSFDNVFIYFFVILNYVPKKCLLKFHYDKCKKHLFILPQKSLYHHLNYSASYIAGFQYHCIYTLQHIPEDDSFYLACVQRQLLKLLVLCNKCYMERIDHGNYSWCVLSTFSVEFAFI